MTARGQNMAQNLQGVADLFNKGSNNEHNPSRITITEQCGGMCTGSYVAAMVCKGAQTVDVHLQLDHHSICDVGTLQRDVLMATSGPSAPKCIFGELEEVVPYSLRITVAEKQAVFRKVLNSLLQCNKGSTKWGSATCNETAVCISVLFLVLGIYPVSPTTNTSAADGLLLPPPTTLLQVCFC